MLNVGPFRVGIMGLITTNTKEISLALEVMCFFLLLIQQSCLAKELKGQGANLIVALAHLDLLKTWSLYKVVIVDVVLLSGHDHYYISWDDGKTVWMEAGENSEKVGVMDVHMKSFMKRGKKTV